MKNLLICLLVLLCSCGGLDNKKVIVSETGQEYEIRIIQNCEYLLIESTTYGGWRILSITHKGNCKNTIHKLK